MSGWRKKESESLFHFLWGEKKSVWETEVERWLGVVSKEGGKKVIIVNNVVWWAFLLTELTQVSMKPQITHTEPLFYTNSPIPASFLRACPSVAFI